MDDKLLRFFKKISFNDVEAFENCHLKECVINRKENTWTIRIIGDELVPVSSIIQLKTLCADGLEEVNKINIEIEYTHLDPNIVLDYFLYYLDIIIKEFPSLSGINKDNIYIDDDVIIIEVVSKSEETLLKKETKKIIKKLETLGITGFEVSFVINEQEKESIRKNIEKTKEDIEIPAPIVQEETKKKWEPRKKVDFQREGTIPISAIDREENSVNFDAYIFDTDFTVLTKKDGTPLYLVTLKISDDTSSILAKTFAKDEEEFALFSKELKKDNWYHFVGQVRMDTYAKDLVFQMRSYEPIESRIIKRKDEAEEKRVELHAHTMMSQMDGVIDEVALVKQAIAWGHAGVAITDHDGCQAFPHVFDEITSYNKKKKKEFDAQIKDLEATIEKIKETGSEEGIKELEHNIEELTEEKKNYKPFKAAYGVELEMCESNLNVCFNPSKDKIAGNTFVVFDTETTGFNPGLGDSIIEVGGVKIRDGEVIDRFDELINPGHPIDIEITRVTDISDDDVKDCDNEENVIKRFKDWIGDLPLVAHNAKFDKNMLDMAYYKYDLGELKNPIIDTLNLSRVINRDLKKHSLAALGKAYGIDTGEVDDEDESSNDIPSGSYIFEGIQNEEIIDIKIDGESIVKERVTEYQEPDITTEEMITKYRHEKYIEVIHKASKTDSVNIEVECMDGISLVNFDNKLKLHPAENTLEISYMTDFGIKTIPITIYVGQHHGADVDSENTGYIFNKMLKQIEGIKTLDELNNLQLLEEIAFKNDPKKLQNIGDLVSYKNYIKKLDEDEEPNNFGNPFTKYNIEGYEWKYSWCNDNNLQMYENIPGKTITEHIANMYDSIKHVTLIAKNHNGLKNLFKIISFANTNFLHRNAKIPRRLIEEYRDNILVGSACLNGEIFYLAEVRSDEELEEAMKFYDYIEVQPLENYQHLLDDHSINNMDHLKELVKKIIRCAKKAKKLIVATGDVHNLSKEDNLSREIIVNQNVPGKGRHPLARCLNGKNKQNTNRDNINEAIKIAEHAGVKLTYVDIKVLKYIYALTKIKEIEITPSNIVALYVPEKHNEEELSVRGSEQDKRYAIEASLRKLQIANLVNVNYATGEYTLNAPYNDSEYPVGGDIPNQYFRTTDEMLEAFNWLDDPELVKEIVITNPNKIIDMLDEIEVIVFPDKPFSPIIEHSQETCRDLVYEKAHSMYGDPLPNNIEDRIAQEFYGDKIIGLVKDQMHIDYPELSDEEIEEKFTPYLHDVIMSGYDGVVNLKKKAILRELPDLSEEEAITKAKAELTGIIGGGFDVIYLIAQKLVKHSNDDGYLVGSRGSVGSSFVASMMGITECNSLPAHYYCPNCQHNEFNDENGNPLVEAYPSGYDLPNKKCPECGTTMVHQGNDMPFATFLGFAGEKVPDIDLNFSGLNQAAAHEYTKVLFGTDNVYRAGTIGTVADKTAFGYVQGFFEERLHNALKIECNSYKLSIPYKDELKKIGIIKSHMRIPEVERLALRCTGVKRTTGQHPGGIVVVPGYKDVWDFTPFQFPADDQNAAWRTTHFDYHKIEADLLKLDILGHDDPTVLRKLKELSNIDVTQIDLGDPDTMKIFTGPEILGVDRYRLRGFVDKDGKKYCPTGTLGVPEFGTSFLLGMLEETKPTTFAELIKISGLSHGTDVWLGNARDLIVNNVVPFSQVIGCRDDIMVNLMAWGIPAGKAFKIMEFVRKGKPSKDPATWKEHADYLKEHNIPDWYIDSCRKIKYMFPKAHATAYVTSAFRIAWFKVHHPIWYYCAYLSIRRDQFDIASMIRGEQAIRDKIDAYDAQPTLSNKDSDIRDTLLICLEMCCRGFYFKNIDIELSEAQDFVITEDQKGLIIPFSALDGLGENVAKAIIKARSKAPFISCEDLCTRGKVNQSALEKLRELGCLDSLPESNQLSLF